MNIQQFEQIILGYWPDNLYLQGLVMLLVGLLAVLIIQLTVLTWAKSIAKKTKTQVDDLILEYISKPLLLTMALIVFRFAFNHINANSIILHILESALIIALTYIVVGIIDVVIEEWGLEYVKKTESTLDDQLLPIFHKFVRVLSIIIAFILILYDWNVNIVPFIASLGIAGIAIGFALKDSLANIFGGISLILDNSFKIGDVIQTEKGDVGEIVEVGIRSTKIKTADNEIVTIPNGNLSIATVRNRGLPNPSIRVTIPINVEYGTEPDYVKKIVLNSIKGLSHLMNDPEPNVKFLQMADSSLSFSLYFFIDDYTKRVDITDEANIRVYNALRKAKIVIPYPTRTIYTKKAR